SGRGGENGANRAVLVTLQKIPRKTPGKFNHFSKQPIPATAREPGRCALCPLPGRAAVRPICPDPSALTHLPGGLNYVRERQPDLPLVIRAAPAGLHCPQSRHPCL